MRDLLRRIWRWMFGPRYYQVMMQWEWRGESFAASSHAQYFGGCPNTGVFEEYNDAVRYYYSRVNDTHDPGLTYTIVDVTHDELLVAEYKERKNAWAS